MKTGDIISFSGTKWYSYIIRLFTRSKISHVGILVWINLNNGNPDRLCILEAHALKGVRLAPLDDVIERDYSSKRAKVFHHRNLLDGDKTASLAMKYWNSRYASWYQFVIIASLTVKWIRNLLGRPLDQNPERVHCSELVTKALVESGYEHDKDPSITTPGDVSNFSCLGRPTRIK